MLELKFIFDTRSV